MPPPSTPGPGANHRVPMAQQMQRKAVVSPYTTQYLPHEQRTHQGVPADLPAWAMPSTFASRHAPIAPKPSRRSISRENLLSIPSVGKLKAAAPAQTKQPLSPRSSKVNALSPACVTASSPPVVAPSIGITRKESEDEIVFIARKPAASPLSGDRNKPKKTKVDKLRVAKSSKPEPATLDTINAALKRRQKGDKAAAKLKNAGGKKGKVSLASYLFPKTKPPRRALDCDKKTLARDILRSLGQPTGYRLALPEDIQSAQTSPIA